MERYLDNEVLVNLEQAVVATCSLLQNSDAKDLKRFVRRENGGITSQIAPYKGFQTSLKVRREAVEKKINEKFVHALERHHPEITGWFGSWSGGAAYERDSLIHCFASQLYELPKDIFYLKFNDLIRDLEKLFISKKIEMSLIIPMGIWTDTSISKSIKISPNLILRPISDQEYEELFSSDIINDRNVSEFLGPVSMVLEGTFESDLYLQPQFETDSKKLEKISEIYHWHEQAIQILQLFKDGNPMILQQIINPKSSCLPIGKFGQKFSASNGLHSPYLLNDQDISELEKLSVRVNKFYSIDPLLKCLLRFYSAARQNYQAELVFLFDVFEALEKRFEGSPRVAVSTGVSRNRMDKLSQLANTEIFQGRHKGHNYKSIRDATQEELNEARTIAKELIIGYLEYLEKSSV